MSGAADRRASLWLAAGAAAGLGLALWGLLEAPASPAARSDAEGVVATVNGVPLSGEAYRQRLAALVPDGRAPSEVERRRVLERMIDEELLVQRGLELGLARHDPRVRADLVGAVIDAINARAEGELPDEAELRAFHAENRAYFSSPGRVRLQHLYVSAARGDDGAVLARSLRARLEEGEPFERLAADSDPPVAPLPDALLPAVRLTRYLGAELAAAARALEAGAVVGPVASNGGWHVLRAVERTGAAAPPFERVRAQVLAEWRRRAGERALREELAELRRFARVEHGP